MRVPHNSPESALAITFSTFPLVMIIGTPETWALDAASSFDAIPPRPTPDEVPPASSLSSGVMLSTTGMRQASQLTRGSQSIRPSMSVSVIRRSALARTATSAERLSLSPSLISSTTTVSFSLIMGTTPQASSVVRVLRALRYLCR